MMALNKVWNTIQQNSVFSFSASADQTANTNRSEYLQREERNLNRKNREGVDGEERSYKEVVA